MVGLRWVSYRRKAELEAMADEFGFEREGTVEELRARLAAFINRKDHTSDVISRLQALEAKFGTAASPDRRLPVFDTAPTASPAVGEEGRMRSAHISAPETKPIVATQTLTVPQPSAPRNSTTSHTQGPFQQHTTSIEQQGYSTGTERQDGAAFAHTADRMRRWGITFDGSSDPLRFIELLEERATSYRIDTRDMPQAIPELLLGSAEDWFRTSGLQGETWSVFRREFLDFFLPPRYFQRLEDEIRLRYQKSGEPYKTYMVDIRLRMRRAGYSEAQELERVYENLLPEYQLFIRRHDFRTLRELTTLTTNYEVTRERERERSQWNSYQEQRQQPTPGPRGPDTRPNAWIPQQGQQPNIGGNEVQPCQGAPLGQPINVREACRNCGTPGHFARECRNPRVLFCWSCGKRGVRTVDCCQVQPSGNGQPPSLKPDAAGALGTNVRK